MSRFTTAEQVEILAEAHRNLAQPNPGSRFSPIERAQIMRQARENVAAFHATEPAAAKRDERTIVYKTVEAQPPPGAVAGSEQLWWEWVQEHVDSQVAILNDATGEVIGTLVGRVRDALDQHIASQKCELELLRREFAVLRDEVGVEKGLKDLRTRVAKAQREVPKVPAIEARLRAEASVAGVKVDQEVAELRRELTAAQRTIVELQAKQAELPGAVEEMLGEALANVELEEWYEFVSRRSVYRPTISPDAAAGLRAFAQKTLGTGNGVIIEH